MNYIIDHSLALLLILLLAYLAVSFYQEYIQRRNKISDKQLMENFVFITMKERSRAYFPKMEIDYE